MKKIKFTSIILTVLMLISVVPFSASATAQSAINDLNAINIPNVIYGGYVLPLSGGIHGSTISWASKNPTITITEDGKVNAGMADKANVTLTATANHNGDVETKDFTVTVKRNTVIFADDFETTATTPHGYNGWYRTSDGAGTEFSIEAESAENDNKVLKMHKLTSETQTSNHILRFFDPALTEDKDVIFSMKLHCDQTLTLVNFLLHGQWRRTSGTLHEGYADGTAVEMINLNFDYAANVVKIYGIDPNKGAIAQTMIVAKNCLKVDEWQTFEMQLDESKQSIWLLLDGNKITNKPLPYYWYQDYGLENLVRPAGGYNNYATTDAIYRLYITMVNAGDAAGAESTLMIDDFEVATEEADNSDKAINVEYLDTDWDTLNFSPRKYHRVWRARVGAENAGNTAILAVYDNKDALVTCQLAPVDENGNAVWDYTLGSTADEIKVFLWDDVETLKPLSASLLENVR